MDMHISGSLEDISRSIDILRRSPVSGVSPIEEGPTTKAPELSKIYSASDISPFPPSAAIYFMDGYSSATIKIRESGEQMTLEFWDQNTSISASKPCLFEELNGGGLLAPTPSPLSSTAFLPTNLPERFRRETATILMQVISMNMRSPDNSSSLLIGLPYAEAYPELFSRSNTFDNPSNDASSFGVMQSLTDYQDPITNQIEETSNGFPARSVFNVLHLITTPVGDFFNKKPTQMELQRSREGKLALKLPPIPFRYALINGPIPLYLVDNPDGGPIADLIAAHHNDAGPAMVQTKDAWPWR